jgi:alkylhydroperoxidase family enzyme
MIMKRIVITAGALILISVSPWSAAGEPSSVPKPIPATRPEMKAALEALKERQPRIALPTSAEGEAIASYLPDTWRGGVLSAIGQYKLDYLFTDRCFWVVSRGNNCHYCLGHQELKLRAAGLDDDTIAALDSDWSRFDPRQQAALDFARKLTLEPEFVGDDIAKLKKVFTDPEIIELAFTIARFNAVNRWTDTIGLPQERPSVDEGEGTFMTPTSVQFQHTASIVLPATRASRQGLPSLDEVKLAVAACRKRKARVELPDEQKARGALASVIRGRQPLAWERAMSQLAATGASQVATYNTIMTDEHLPLRLKAELALISAIHNRAWYAVGRASNRLRELGVSEKEMVTLFDDVPETSGGAAASHRLAAKSTAYPHLITDADIASVRAHYSDRETAQIVQVICMANFFDRFTEALGLPLEAN